MLVGTNSKVRGHHKRASRVARFSGVLALATFGLLASGTPPAGASTSPTLVPGTVTLEGLACPTKRLCIAVGYADNAQTISLPRLLTITKGTPNQVQNLPGLGSLSGVACWTSTNCVAVGDNSDGNTNKGEIVPITRGHAGTPVVLPAVSGLSDVACPTSTCLAVGYGAQLVPITNGNIGAPEELTAPVDSIACATSSFCIAVGQVSETTPYDQQFLAPAVVPITNGVPGHEIDNGDSSDHVNGVGSAFCPTATTCWFTADSDNGYQLFETFTNGGISPSQVVPGSADLGGMACPTSATTCFVTGETPVNGVQEGAVVPIIQGAPGNPTTATGTSGLVDVVCATSTKCLSTGDVAMGASYEGLLLALTPPTTTVTAPSSGATLSGTQPLIAAASDNAGVTRVEFAVSGKGLHKVVIADATSTSNGWTGSWDTTSVRNGTYRLQSLAYDPEGFSTYSSPVTITVANP